MTLRVVDFNLEDEKGRLPVAIDAAAVRNIRTGDFVVVEDEEGHSCKARVEEISVENLVVFLTPVRGTWEGPAPSA